MAMVNPAVLNLAAAANAKDSRWLTLEVCREFQRSKCTRSDQECKFAHPPPHVEVQSGRVTACFDSIKGKCQRKEPPCKYLHPPQHLREQLLQNGRNNLILKNLQFQAAQQAALNQGLMSGLIPVNRSTTEITTPALRQVIPQTNNNVAQYSSSTVQAFQRAHPEMFEAGANKTTMAFPHTVLSAGQYSPMLAHPYLGGTAPPTTAVAFSPYMNAGLQTVTVTGAQTNCESPALVSQHHGVIPTAFSNMAAANKVARPDRLEVCREFQRGTCTRQPSECRFAHPPDNVTVDTEENCVTVCMDYIKGKCTRDSCRYFHPPLHLQAQIKACQQRANAAAAAQAHALPHVVEVLTGKKRPRDPSEEMMLYNAIFQSQVPGMMGQIKRVAMADTKGLPMYQPFTNVSYQQAIAAMQLQHQPQYIPVSLPMMVAPEMATLVPGPLPGSIVPNNAHSVNYFDENRQLLDNLPVCKDFKLGLCQRPTCKYVHIIEEYVEVNDGRVIVCRDAVRGKCSRPTCKYYHIPVPLPPSE
ncbi:muscleblind-like protein 3 isoform X5 [Dreissena polymorpha]|uniref:muscleblind-like protein 3 isoform X5 n=1 Tax=Dreissena polymorpha TaxID=45954 RepID=UPI002263E76E|nr:muscleblind-like protein 3 isoform X5 [Dreissena polymorpha]